METDFATKFREVITTLSTVPYRLSAKEEAAVWEHVTGGRLSSHGKPVWVRTYQGTDALGGPSYGHGSAGVWVSITWLAREMRRRNVEYANARSLLKPGHMYLYSEPEYIGEYPGKQALKENA